ncbi:MAG: hypothetical protein ACFB02_10570 [Mastigocoleus sp.]
MNILYLLLPLLAVGIIPSFAQNPIFQQNYLSKYEKIKRQPPKEDHRGGGRREFYILGLVSN